MFPIHAIQSVNLWVQNLWSTHLWLKNSTLPCSVPLQKPAPQKVLMQKAPILNQSGYSGSKDGFCHGTRTCPYLSLYMVCGPAPSCSNDRHLHSRLCPMSLPHTSEWLIFACNEGFLSLLLLDLIWSTQDPVPTCSNACGEGCLAPI